MWKRLLIVIISLVGTFSFVYAMDHDINANNSSFSVGGEAYGQLGAPSLGDRIYLGTQSNLGEDLGWVLLADYSTPNSTTGFVGNNAWFAMSTAPLAMTTYYDNVNKIPIYFHQYLTPNTAAYNSLEDFNLRLSSNKKDMAVVTERNVEWFNSLYTHTGIQQYFSHSDYGDAKLLALNKWPDDWTYGAGGNSDFSSAENLEKARVTERFHFWKTSEDYGIVDDGAGGYVGKKVAYPYSYLQENASLNDYCKISANPYCPWTTDLATQPKIIAVPKVQTKSFYVNNKETPYWQGFHFFGSGWENATDLINNRAILAIGGDQSYKISFGSYEQPNTGTSDIGASPINAVRPAINFNKSVLDSVVFSLASSSSNTGVVKVNPAVKTLGVYNTNEDMKIRIESSATRATFNDILLGNESVYTIQNIAKTETAKLANNEIIKLQVDANEGFDDYGIYTVSVIITDENGTFIAYAPLDRTKDGIYNYELDLNKFTLLKNGKKYYIQVVNESYSEQNVTPSDCSPLSTAYAIELYDPLDQLTATTKSGLVYGNNDVLGGAIVGSVSTMNGYGTPIYTIVEDSKYPKEANDFELGMIADDANGKHIASIVVKQGITALNAGTYHFKIEAQDSFKSPAIPMSIDVSITVDKTTTILEFDNDNLVETKIGEAPLTDSITFTNTDSSFTPKLTFTSDKGDTSLLTVQLDPNDPTKYIVTPASSYSGTSLPASYTLTLSGEETENFKAPDPVTKTYYLYKELSGLEWNAVSSSINVNDVSTSGVTVGTLLAKDGYPDYTYELVSSSDKDYNSSTGKDNASFILDQTKASYGTKINVKTTGKLSAKQYYLQFKVTDGKGATQLQTGTFTVTANAQSSLSFYDKQGGTKISSLSVTYGDTSKKLYAEGGSTSKNIIYGFAPSDQQPSDLKGSAQDYANINTSTGEITPLKVGTIKVMATRPGDDTYSATSVTMDLSITNGEQTISFNSTIPKKKAFKENEEISIPATLTRDDKTKGTITYTSETPTVCIVEDETIAKVKMLTKGICSIKAYNEDDNYKNVEDHVTIQLYEGIQAVFTPKANVKQGDQSTKADDPTGLATITLSKGDGTYTFDAMTIKKDGVTQSNLFELTGSGTAYKITPKQDVTYGTYDVSIKFKDGQNAETEVTGTITIGLQENKDFILMYDGSKATSISKDFQSVKTNGIQLDTKDKLGNGTIIYAPAATNVKDPDESIEALEIDPVTGVISVNRVTTSSDHYEFYAYIEEDETNGYAKQETQKVTVTITPSEQNISFTDSKGNVISDISETYAISPNNTFQLYTKKLGSGTVTYELKPGSSSTVVSVSDSGVVTILKATSTTAPETVIIVATVEAKDGYESKSVEIPVTIKQATQTIQWKDKDNSFVEFDEEQGYADTIETAVLDRADKTTGSISYESENTDICTIDTQGNIKGLQTGTCTIKAKNTDTNYTKAEISKTVTFYSGFSGEFVPSKKQLQANSSKTNAVAGSITITGGSTDQELIYAIHDGESDLFKIADETFSTISLARDLSIDDLQGISYEPKKGGYPIKLKVDVTDQVTSAAVTIECVIIIKGADQTLVGFNDGKGNKTSKIERVYEEDGTFSLGLLDNSGGSPTYSLKTNSPEDVIEVTGNIVTILNANDQANDARTVIVQAEIAAKNGYDVKTIECEVEITKAEQTSFKFSSDQITMLPDSKTIPKLEGGVPLEKDKGEGIITLISDAQHIVSVDTKDPTQILSHDEGTAKLTALITGNRNYKDGKAETKVVVTTAPAYAFKLSVPTATYGDTQEIKASIIVGSTPPSKDGVVTRTWTSSDEAIATIDENGIITIKNAGTTTIKCVQESTKDDAVSDSVTFTVKQKPVTVTLDDKEIGMGEEIPEFTYTIEEGVILDQDLATFLAPAFSCFDQDNVAVSERTKPGSYTINAVYDTTSLPYKNYKITIKQGTLKITQDTSQSTWLTLIGHDTKKTLNSNDWHKEAVEITINQTISTPYDEISMDGTTWSKSILITNEGNQELEVYFRNSATQSQATTQKVTVKLDLTKPMIESISGVPVPQNVLEKTLNNLTYGTWFKPNDELTIQAKDTDKETVNEISGLSELHYEVYELNDKNVKSETPYSSQTVPMNTSTKTFKIVNPGQYRICATVKDKAGNESAEYCSDVHIKKINVDADNDDIPDFNDTDDNGCPDLNIVLGTDKDGNKVKLNVAEQDKNYPYMNIDSNGDGKADLNIDTDFDGKPDLNLVIMSESLWEPKICVLEENLSDYSEPNEYCTGTAVKAEVNVDLDGDLVPDINIITKGNLNDGQWIPDINITKEGSTKPYLNIVSLHVWEPKKDLSYDTFAYDTMEIKPVLNIDTDQDGSPDLNLDLNGDGKADLNIDIDGDGIPDTNIDTTGDGKPDLNIDVEKDGIPKENIYKLTEWKPEKAVHGLIEYDTMELSNKDNLEDQGIIIENPQGNFLPNFAIRVNDVTEIEKETIMKEAKDQLRDDQEIKVVYDVTLLKDQVETQPDGTLKVRIPIPDGMKNPKLLVKTAQGDYVLVDAQIEDGYLVYETEYVGRVAIIDDIEPSSKPTEPVEPKEPTNTKDAMIDDTTSDVQGEYHLGANMGGALSGDDTSIVIYVVLLSSSFLLLGFIIKKHKKQSS